MGLLFLYAFISVLLSFLCSILEAVLLSISPTFISLKKKEGKAYAATLDVLKKDVDKPLIAILTINTIAQTVGSILVGVQVKAAYVSLFGLHKHTYIDVHITDELMLVVVSTIMTILILDSS